MRSLDRALGDLVDPVSGALKSFVTSAPVEPRSHSGCSGERFVRLASLWLGTGVCSLGFTPLLRLSSGSCSRVLARLRLRTRLIGPCGSPCSRFGLLGVDHVTVYERQPTVRKAGFRLRR